MSQMHALLKKNTPFTIPVLRARKYLVILLIGMILLLPSFPLTSQLKGRPEDFMILLAIPVVLSYRRKKVNGVDFVFLLVGLSTLASMAYGIILLKVPFAINDMMEFVKLGKYWLFFNAGLFAWNERSIHKILHWLVICFGIAAVIGLLEWRGPTSISGILWALYSDSPGDMSAGRIIGTLANPNDFAAMLITGMALILSIWMWYRPRAILVLIISLMGWVFVLIRSRSGVLGLVIIAATIFFLRLVRLRKISSRRWYSAVLFASLLVLLFGSLFGAWVYNQYQSITNMNPRQVLAYVNESPMNYLIYRLVYTVSAEGSISSRTTRWEEHFDLFTQSPIFGWGPGKAIQYGVVDNEYILYLRRYGVVGIFTYLALYYQAIRISRRVLKRYPYTSATWSLGLAILSSTLAYLAINIFTGTFYKLQLMALFWLLIGIAYASVYHYRQERSTQYVQPAES